MKARSKQLQLATVNDSEAESGLFLNVANIDQYHIVRKQLVACTDSTVVLTACTKCTDLSRYIFSYISWNKVYKQLEESEEINSVKLAQQYI